MNAPINTDAEISAALLKHVVNASGQRPSLEISTPKEVFHLVTVTTPILPTVQSGKLISILFFGKDPMGRTRAFVWPPDVAEEPAVGITALEVYGHG